MSNLEQLTLAEMEEFVATSRHVTWSAVEPGSVYRLVERVLKAQPYRRLSQGQRAIVKRFLAKITALSRAPLTRLIRRWMDTRRIARKPARHPSFHRRYSDADIASLAEVDAAHEDLSRPAVRHLMETREKCGRVDPIKQRHHPSKGYRWLLLRSVKSAAYLKRGPSIEK